MRDMYLCSSYTLIYLQILTQTCILCLKGKSELDKDGVVEQGSCSSSSMSITVCRTEGIFHSSITEVKERKRRVVVCKDGSF